jgi:hypothetical protein
VLNLNGSGKDAVIASFTFLIYDDMCPGDTLPLLVHLMTVTLVLLACCFSQECNLLKVMCDEPLILSDSSHIVRSHFVVCELDEEGASDNCIT